ncbi:SIR2 family protein, partial [Leptospira ellisii]
MIIELEELFKKSLAEGVNLFLGSGFSLHAKDVKGRDLPTGMALTKELIENFKMTTSTLTLSQIATILNNTKKSEFIEYLKERFYVSTFDNLYYCLNSIKINQIYTTNIDNLIHKIIDHSQYSYLNDVTINGPKFKEKFATDFIPLHGNILNDDRPIIFDSLQIASTFSNSPETWNYLSQGIVNQPTLFWGYSLNDSGVLQSLEGINKIKKSSELKWIALKDENKDEIEYFKALGFNIVIGETIEILKYFEANSTSHKKQHNQTITNNLFDYEYVPKLSTNFPVQPLSTFFTGGDPSWFNIYNGSLYRIHFFKNVQDKILTNKNIIILGAPASGKTTLLMQLAAYTEFEGHKLFLPAVHENKADLIIKKLNGEKAILFIDNFTDEMEGLKRLSKHSNIKLVCCDRDHNFETVSHLIDRE